MPAPWPLPGALTLTATLAHTLEARRTHCCATPLFAVPDACLCADAQAVGATGVRIAFTEVVLRTRGLRGARPLALPSPLRALGIEAALPESLRGGAFETSFVDGECRVSRGDRGEVRVFVRA